MSIAVSEENKSFAKLTYFITILGGFLVPLYLFLKKKDDEFLFANAKVSLNYTLTLLIGYVAIGIVGGILGSMVPILGTIFSLLNLGLFVVHVVLCIKAANQAGNGQVAAFPFALQLVK
jgi:uncharacterized protein